MVYTRHAAIELPPGHWSRGPALGGREVACSPELGTTEGYPFKIDFNLLS